MSNLPTERFTDNEERYHESRTRIESEYRFGIHAVSDYDRRHARITRTITRRIAAIKIRQLRERNSR